jgi:Domain of unknown function (DUF4365)
MSKQRGETHLKEDDSEGLVKSLLPPEWVIRKLHPDYGVDITIEVFERQANGIPTMGEFLFAQIKGTADLKRKVEPIRIRGNVEKTHDRQEGKVAYELDAVSFVVDTDTIDNARLMGPSTPLMLFVCDLNNREIYFVCLTDYYDKILEPRGVSLSDQATVTLVIPASNRLSAAHSVQAMRFFAARAKLYGLFNLAQFQYREIRQLLPEFSNHEHLAEIDQNFAIIERFARRLRGMPIWDRELPWALLPHYRDRLDLILKNVDADALTLIKAGIVEFMRGNDQALTPLFEFHNLCSMSWEQFSAIGQTFEDLVREWFLPTYVGQLGSGEDVFLREVADPSATAPTASAKGSQ